MTDRAPICFVDTETTGLSLDDDVWEFAALRLEPDGYVQSISIFIEHNIGKCSLLPEPFLSDHRRRYQLDAARSKPSAAVTINDYTAGAHLIGAVPSFDSERLARLLRNEGLEPKWHYHLGDVENFAVGYLAGRRSMSKGIIPADLAPPWDSEDLSRAVGVEPDNYDRHTAMGDVLWARAIYDRVMG